MVDLEGILARIRSKRSDYLLYSFTDRENDAFKTFFDLAQEFDDIRDFQALCVAIPKEFFGLDARLYGISPKSNELALVVATDDCSGQTELPEIKAGEGACPTPGGGLAFAIKGNELLLDQLPFRAADGVLGVLEVFPAADFDEHRRLFFQKYANRIGYNMHNRYIVEKNIEHLRFIRTLVADIEHNVISPNMVYRLYLRNLKGKILRNQVMENQLSDLLASPELDREGLERFLSELSDVNEGLKNELLNMERHYNNMSLFLETLLRRSHFDYGRLMIRTKKCNIKKDVLEPQIQQYRERFQRMEIEIDDRTSGIPEEEDINVVDVGLIAQVYANLFSNALKYTQPVATEAGEKKYISYGREVAKDYFGPGKDGVKYNVFSTGPHINPEEHDKLFKEGYRGREVMDRPGSGHGLAFVKTVLEMHGGVTGYEATRYGNNFYFILPR